MIDANKRLELSWRARLVKRTFDLLTALTAIFLLAPLLVVIAYAIWRDGKGPILFRQGREGYRCTLFTIFKFRTMVADADKQAGFRQARQHDPRVTRLGAFLRNSSFDELPQLFNILSGKMSVVGPRPHVPELSGRFSDKIESYYDRLNTQPGLTGLAQISGLRGETETLDKMRERVRLDVEYISTWSLSREVSICVATARTAIGEDAAY